VTGFSKDSNGVVTELQATCERDYLESGRKPPKGVLNWVARPKPGMEPPVCEAR
jgi:glutaminyl-tRNA synthetase